MVKNLAIIPISRNILNSLSPYDRLISIYEHHELRELIDARIIKKLLRTVMTYSSDEIECSEDALVYLKLIEATYDEVFASLCLSVDIEDRIPNIDTSRTYLTDLAVTVNNVINTHLPNTNNLAYYITDKLDTTLSYYMVLGIDYDSINDELILELLYMSPS